MTTTTTGHEHEYEAETSIKLNARSGLEAWNRTRIMAEEIAKYLPEHDRCKFN
jgi:hypothetical protein